MELIIIFATLSAANIYGVSFFTSEYRPTINNEHILETREKKKIGGGSLVEALFPEKTN